MNYTLTPSLEHIALVKIAIILWNQDDIKDLMSKFYFPFGTERREKWQEIEDKVTEKVPQLPQPEPLKEEILGCIKPIGLQILKWMEYHRHFLRGICVKNNVSKLFWTPQGTVNKKKTAKALIKDKYINVTRRYKLACIYCLEDDIRELWNRIPEDRKKSFYSEEDPTNVDQQKLVVFWTYDMKGEMARMGNMIEERWQSKCSPYQYAFEYAAVGGNKAATEYYLQKLIPKEREESLVRSAGYVTNRHADVLCFLLSQMDEEQQIEVFKSYSVSYRVLNFLLCWPWQSLFMETANRMWDFLSGHHCHYLLIKMVDKVIEGHKDYDYQKLFGEFWQHSPNAHKRYVIDECASGFLLSRLFKIKDEKNLKFILRDATLIEKKKLIFCDSGQVICHLIYDDEWGLLKFFIRECVSSKDEMIKFKEEFKKRITRCCSQEKLVRNEDKWNKFFQLLDNFIKEFNNKRRTIEEGESSPAKRLHNTELEEKR